MDIEVILHSDNTAGTDICYKDINAHNYLPCNSAHCKHCKDNLPYNLAKRIIVFVSNDEKVEMRLKELTNWLKVCNYPDSVINQSFYNSKLQGPALFTDNLKNIPFVTTYYENIGNEKVVKKLVLICQIFNQEIFWRCLKMKILFFHKSSQNTYSNY